MQEEPVTFSAQQLRELGVPVDAIFHAPRALEELTFTFRTDGDSARFHFGVKVTKGDTGDIETQEHEMVGLVRALEDLFYRTGAMDVPRFRDLFTRDFSAEVELNGRRLTLPESWDQG